MELAYFEDIEIREKNVVVQGKCQGLVFSDFVSRVMDIPLRIPPLVQVVRAGNAEDHHY